MAVKFLLCGNYGATNIGDEAILKSMINIINKACSDNEITVLSANPISTKSIFNVDSVPFIPAGFRSFIKGILSGCFLQTIKSFKNTDYFVLGGGGLLTDEKIKAIWIWYLQFFFAKIYRKKVICLGQSVGPLNTYFGKAVTKAIYKYSLLNSVRDKKSSEILNSLGIKHVKITSDLVFGLADQKNSLNKGGTTSEGKYIVLNLRPWIKGNKSLINRSLASYVDWLFENYKIKTVGVAFQKNIDDDYEELSELKVLIKNKDSFTVYPFSEDLEEICKVLERAEWVVSMRLHTLILSAINNTPFIALSYSQKVNSLVEMISDSSYNIDYEKTNLESLISSSQKMITERASYKNKLSEKLEALKENALQNVDFIKQIL